MRRINALSEGPEGGSGLPYPFLGFGRNSNSFFSTLLHAMEFDEPRFARPARIVPGAQGTAAVEEDAGRDPSAEIFDQRREETGDLVRHGLDALRGRVNRRPAAAGRLAGHGAQHVREIGHAEFGREVRDRWRRRRPRARPGLSPGMATPSSTAGRLSVLRLGEDGREILPSASRAAVRRGSRWRRARPPADRRSIPSTLQS